MLYLAIQKVGATDRSAEYRFGVEGQEPGLLSIDLQTGVVNLLVAAAGDEAGRYFARAAYKLGQHSAAGELPERTCWAS